MMRSDAHDHLGERSIRRRHGSYSAHASCNAFPGASRASALGDRVPQRRPTTRSRTVAIPRSSSTVNWNRSVPRVIRAPSSAKRRKDFGARLTRKGGPSMFATHSTVQGPPIDGAKRGWRRCKAALNCLASAVEIRTVASKPSNFTQNHAVVLVSFAGERAQTSLMRTRHSCPIAINDFDTRVRLPFRAKHSHFKSYVKWSINPYSDKILKRGGGANNDRFNRESLASRMGLAA